MSKNQTDENLASVVMNNRNQSEAVPANIEYGIRSNVIRTPKNFFHMVEVFKYCLLNQRMPIPHRRFSFGMFSPKCPQRLERNNVHK